MSTLIKEIDDDNFVATVEKGLTIVDFWAPWCGPCKALTPILENAAKQHTQVQFIKINVDEHKIIAGQYGIRGIPSLLLFKDGQHLETKIGLINLDDLTALIESAST
jgi:thioredoxin 1